MLEKPPENLDIDTGGIQVGIYMALKPGRAPCSPKPESETIHEIMQNRDQSFKVDLS